MVKSVALIILSATVAQADTVASFDLTALQPQKMPSPKSKATWQSATLARAPGGALIATASGQPSQGISWSIPLRPLPRGNYEVSLVVTEDGIAPRYKSIYLSNAEHRELMFQATGGAGKERLTVFWEHAEAPTGLIIGLSPAGAAPSTLKIENVIFALQSNFPTREMIDTHLKKWSPLQKQLAPDDLNGIRAVSDQTPIVGIITPPYRQAKQNPVRIRINLGVSDARDASICPYPNYFDSTPIHAALDTCTSNDGPIWLEFDARKLPTWLEDQDSGTAPLDVTARWRDHHRDTIAATAAAMLQHPASKRIVGATIYISQRNLPSPQRHDHALYLPAFRKWLKTKYESDNAIATAWQESDLRLESAMPAPPKAWQSGTLGPWIHPAQQQIIDSRTFFNLTWADSLLFFARTISETLPGIMIAIPDGPFLAFTDNPAATQCTAFALEKILSSKHVDAVEISLTNAIIPSLTAWFASYGKATIVSPREPLRNRESLRHFLGTTAVAGAIPFLPIPPVLSDTDTDIFANAFSRTPEPTIWTLQTTNVPIRPSAFDYLSDSGATTRNSIETLMQHWLAYGLPVSLQAPHAGTPGISIEHFTRQPQTGSLRIHYAHGALADVATKTVSPRQHHLATIRLSAKPNSNSWEPTPTLNELMGQRISVTTPGFPRSSPQSFRPGIQLHAKSTAMTLATTAENLPVLLLDEANQKDLLTTAPIVPHEVIRALLAKQGISALNSTPDPTHLRGKLLALYTATGEGVRQINFPAPTALYEVFRDQEIAPAKSHHLELTPDRSWLFYLGTKDQWKATQ